jgi:uncharacterized protein (TIGR03067 family)
MLHRRAGLLLILGLGLLVASAPMAKDDDVAAEDKKFEGVWVVTGLEVNGMAAPEENYSNQTFTFKGKEYVQKAGDQVIEAGTQDLNPKKKPKEMDIKVTEGETKDQLQLAIYEIEGDNLKVCAARHGDKERPKEFVTKAGSGHMLFTMKRKK